MNYKLFAVALVATSVGLSSAQAADIARPVYKAPVAAPMFSWTGCYVGGHAGYGWGTSKFIDPVLGPFADFDSDGGVVGGQIGCDYQTGAWVFGLEGQGSWANLDGSGPDTLSVTGDTLESKITSIWSATARLGYAWDQSLLYVKGGWAGARGEFVGIAGTGAVFADVSSNFSGWTIGGGWEQMFAPNWSWKVEYMYMDLGSRDTSTPDLLLGGTFQQNTEMTAQTLKFGINYRFGGYGKSPVIAKY